MKYTSGFKKATPANSAQRNKAPLGQKQAELLSVAAKVATKQATKQVGVQELVEAGEGKLSKTKATKLLRECAGMSEEEFLRLVTGKMKHIVNDTLDAFHDKLQDIPPQNLAFALSVVTDKLLTLTGRPSNITANATVNLGSSDITPDKAREMLKAAATPAEVSE